jgi:predicted YcjX-like family ATPase
VLGPVSYLWFAPLDIAEGADVFAPHTLGALMAERFETYKRDVVERFYQDHFRHYSRQIVLVDVLRALLAGRDAFETWRNAGYLNRLLDKFRAADGVADERPRRVLIKTRRCRVLGLSGIFRSTRALLV